MSEPRRAASVVLLRQRPGKAQMQVLMALRSQNMKSFSGVYVFPGGVMEQHDGPAQSREASKRCGLRELFEECGVLLAAGDNGSVRAHGIAPQRKKRWMEAVHDDAGQFESVVQEENVRLALDSMGFVCSFITPKIEQRRFDTDFFVVAVDDADVLIDTEETASFKWVTPKDAIELNAIGKMRFLPPQFFVLSALAEFQDARECARFFVTRPVAQEPVPILPHAVAMDEKEVVLAYPGDEEHPVYPGKVGRRQRIHVKAPMGSAGFYLESNLGVPTLTRELAANM